MKQKSIKRMIGILVCTAAAAMAVPAVVPADEEVFDPLSIIHDTVDYEIYLQEHEDAAYPDTEIVIEGGDFAEADEGFEVYEDYMELGHDALLSPEEGSVTYEVEVEEAGMYNMELTYYPAEGKNNSIERELYINGEIPFSAAQYLKFSRRWEDAEEIAQDSRENDVRPKQTEAPVWMTSWMKDSDGYYTSAFSFYFEEGVNTITLSSTKEPMVIGTITLKQEEQPISYEEYLTYHTEQGHKAAVLPEGSIKYQGEDVSWKSDSTLYPISDRTSPLTEPYHASKTRLNIVGGSNWKLVGQWLAWEIEVPEDGLYELAFKYRQNINVGVTVVRSLEIDGELPFEEARNLKFYYENDWQIAALGDDEQAYQFYLEAGTHTLKMEITLGDEMAEILRLTDSCITELNRAYRQLLMVIGSSPDTYRDYQLNLKTPEALEILAEQYEQMVEIQQKVDEYSKGSKGSQSAVIDNLINQLQTMTKKHKTIAKQWSSFKDNIISLSSWRQSMTEQPLEIDYFLVGEPGQELPKAEAGFIDKMKHEIAQFAASFVEDYDSIGDVYEGEALEVWLLADASTVNSQSGSGRDQATVLKDLVDNYFVPETNIPVNVKLVNKDVLLSATLAGEGPDVAINVAGKEPVNYALRNAVTDLTQFEDFEEVCSWFHDEAMVQFTLEDGVYALPQTMSFHVLFYRADILKDLGLTVPTTWDEFYECLAVIQKSNMNVGIIPDYTSYAMFLYQHGGSYYTEDGMASGLDTEEAIAAFKQWSGNYVNYRMDVSYDFANRFRSGEMPLAIADYTNYNYLSVFAPDIRGQWGFTVVPGYEDENGEMDYSVSAWESASVIMATSEMQNESWEFLKWWMSAETQTSYGNEIENVLGVSGRVATANLEALSNLPWSNTDYKQLVAQMEWVKAIPEIPGGYFTERHIKNAFYTVYNNNEDARETIQDYVKTINNEIENKRLEFGLEVSKGEGESE